jgi:hypothetical protein
MSSMTVAPSSAIREWQWPELTTGISVETVRKPDATADRAKRWAYPERTIFIS